ncbi:MAG: cytochrome c family protein [Hyphomicrobiales bacterium]
MNSWTFNKMAGAVLGTALLVFGLKTLGGLIYEPHMASADKPGFMIATAEADDGAAAGGDAAAPAKSLGTLLAAANKDAGAGEAKACAACHDFSKGGPNKTGPNLYGVVGRNGASHEGYAYSEGMTTARGGKPWSYEDLNAFIKAPKAAVPGTKMAFGGLKNDEKRANLLAYLGSLADSPVAFPAP